MWEQNEKLSANKFNDIVEQSHFLKNTTFKELTEDEQKILIAFYVLKN